jgi:uncharacterized membrane protein
MDLKNIWQLQLLALSVISIAYLPICYSALKQLKKDQNDLWKEFGSFELFSNNNIQSGYKLIKLLLFKHYQHIQDKDLTSKLNTCRVLLIAGFICAITNFALTMFLIGRA